MAPGGYSCDLNQIVRKTPSRGLAPHMSRDENTGKWLSVEAESLFPIHAPTAVDSIQRPKMIAITSSFPMKRLMNSLSNTICTMKQVKPRMNARDLNTISVGCWLKAVSCRLLAVGCQLSAPSFQLPASSPQPPAPNTYQIYLIPFALPLTFIIFVTIIVKLLDK
jgi:hypothetical protein